MVLTEIYDLLYRLGITANYTGFFHMGYAVKLCCERPERLLMVTKWVYPEVAKRFNTTPSRVERAIRHAIEVAWDRGDLETLQKYFGYTVSNVKGKPTNSEFIAMIADRLQLQQKEM